MTIQQLINKRDNFEVVRDQIVAILVTETASQQSLATAAGEDPDLWKLRVYSERSNPWESFRDRDRDTSPIVNVWYDSSQFEPGSSSVIERQDTAGVFNIDIYGYGVSSENGSGHNAGDEQAAINCQRGVRLVRNMLMASEYTYLGLRGVVGQRWPQAINSFQPQQDSRNVNQIVAARIALRVRFNEFSPQYEGVTLDTLSATVTRAEDGEIVLSAEYDYT